jgi:hypothetical protein
MSALLRLISLACSVILIASFAMFASDQAGQGSKQTVAKITSADDVSGTAGAAAKQPKAKKGHGPVRSTIDDANAKLTSPFKSVVSTHSVWGERIAQSLLAFLVFGVGIGFLARYASTRGV